MAPGGGVSRGNTGGDQSVAPAGCASLQASVENVEQVRGRHTVPEVHEALGRSNPLEATRLRRRDPATDREGPCAPVIILDPQDCEPRRAPWYARHRCTR